MFLSLSLRLSVLKKNVKGSCRRAVAAYSLSTVVCQITLNLAAKNNIRYLSSCSSGVWAWLSGPGVSNEAAMKVSAEAAVSSKGPTVEESTSQLTAALVGRTQSHTDCWPKTSLDALPRVLSHSSLRTWQLACSEQVSG